MMTNGSSIAAATDGVFSHLAEELPRLNPRYLDDTRFLLTVAEVALPPTVDTNLARPADYEARLLLHARVPENALAKVLTQDVIAPATAALRAFLQTPRWVTRAEVQHFKTLATKERTQASLLFNLLDPSVPGSLAELSQNHARPDPAIIEIRQATLLAKKKQCWAALSQALTECRDLTAQEINDLDSFIYEYPDVIALSVPVLGSPLIHCYLAINIAAYYEPALRANLSRTYFHTLRNAVMPFFLARFASLAEHYINSAAEQDQPVAARALRFLREAAGMLVAKRMSITDANGADVLQYAPPDIQDFKDGALVSFEIPFDDARRQVTIRLPQFLAFAPPTDATRDGDVDWRWSADELDGTDVQARTAATVLASLAKLIYKADLANASITLQRTELAERTAQLAEREELIDSAAATLDDLRSDVNRHLGTLSPALAIWRSRRLRAFVDSLSDALDTTDVSETFHTAWIAAGLSDYQGITPWTIRHLLREKFDVVCGALGDAKFEQLRHLLVADIVAATKAKASTQSRAHLDSIDSVFAERLVSLLLWTRISCTRDAGHSGMRSILAWADEKNLLNASTKRISGLNYVRMLTSMSLQTGDELLVKGKRDGWVLLKSLIAEDDVPDIVIPLSLTVVAAWYSNVEQAVDISISRTGGITEVDVTAAPPLNGESRSRSHLVQARETPSNITLAKFAHCTAVLDSIFELAEGTSTKTESGTTNGFILKLKVSP